MKKNDRILKQLTALDTDATSIVKSNENYWVVYAQLLRKENDMSNELTAEEQFWTLVAVSQLPKEVKNQLKQILEDAKVEAYKKGHIDGSISSSGKTCGVCGSGALV